MATNGWTMTRNTTTGNYTLECRESNFNAQEKKIQVNCGNRNMTGDLIVNVKARDAVMNYSSSANRYTISIPTTYYTSHTGDSSYNYSSNLGVNAVKLNRSSDSSSVSCVPTFPTSGSGWVSSYSFNYKINSGEDNDYLNYYNFPLWDVDSTSASILNDEWEDSKVHYYIIKNGVYQHHQGLRSTMYSIFVNLGADALGNGIKLEWSTNGSSYSNAVINEGGTVFQRDGKWRYVEYQGASSVELPTTIKYLRFTQVNPSSASVKILQLSVYPYSLSL